MGFSSGSVVKNLLANAGSSGDMGSIPRSGRSPGGGATHSSILAWKNPMDRAAWWATVQGVERIKEFFEESNMTENAHMH